MRSFQVGSTTIQVQPGRPRPFGATVLADGSLNFALASHHATHAILVLFEKGCPTPMLEIEFLPQDRVGRVFALHVEGVDASQIEYGYRLDAPDLSGPLHRFDPSVVLLDPFARAISGRNVWGRPQANGRVGDLRGQIPTTPFDWEGDRPLNIPLRDLIIYETHVRAFTKHTNSHVQSPGTYAGFIEKIPYLADLGINAIELLPIQEFDEFENPFTNPLTGERLWQFWGYGTLGFFAPKAGFAASGVHGGQINEFKALVKACHQHGIEVILDVVYNHTGEAGQDAHTVSFRGIDNKTYYLHTPDGEYKNYSGTGNTLNCNHPMVREMILESLRYWVDEFHIDGFRFDLASILTRDEGGTPLEKPPIIEAIAQDPILANTKIIAEPWDAGGLYQVGTFPHYDRWSEWNGKYRDSLRQFLKGDVGKTGEVVQRILGSPDLYGERPPHTSINFLNCHDGFTLNDLFSYNGKHNEANGEENRDGSNDNNSWNCGHEGPTDSYDVNWRRYRLMRSAIAILMVSQGVPLFHMGDEVAHTKEGNNNTYGHDSHLNWFDWENIDRHIYLHRFTKQMIAFRRAHPALRSAASFSHTDLVGSGYPDISWHGVRAWEPDWSYHSHTLAFMLCGQHAAMGDGAEDFIYVAINMHWKAHVFELPKLPDGMHWHLFADTGRKSPNDIHEIGREPRLGGQKELILEAHCVVVVIGR